MTKYRIVAAIILIGIARVDGFGTASVKRYGDDLLGVTAASRVWPKHPFSSADRRKKTVLGYRNSPHDTRIDFYAILGVPRTANDKEIKRAYRTLAKQFHPDANPETDTTAIFQELNQAYEILKDPELRGQYDMHGGGVSTSATSDRTAASAAERAANARRPGATSRTAYNNPAAGRQHGPFNPDPFADRNPFNPHERRQAYQSSPYSHARAPGPQPHRSRGPRPQRPTSNYGDSPFGSSWDPWKSPFADVYNARVQEEIYHHQQYNMYDSTFASMGGPSVQNGPAPGCMGEQFEFTTIRPNGGDSGTRRRWVGGDLCIELEIDLQTALEGGEEKIRIKHLESCTTCTGNGIQPGAEVKTCEHCGGSGAVISKTQPSGMGPTNNYSKQEICGHCRGTGQQVAENCSTCHGKGITEASKQITVTIPPGVGDGAKLRLKGEGDAGPMGGPAGDLFIFLSIRSGSPHQQVRMS